MTLRNLLLFRFIVLNACGVAALIWASTLGYVGMIFEGDVSHISHVIAALFALVWISTARNVLSVNTARNANLNLTGYQRRRALLDANKMPLKQAHLWDAVEWLVLLSLIGNAVGFYISSKSIDVSALSSTDGIVANAGRMLGGVGVAISGTIVGGVACLWTWLNVRMLDTATTLYIEDLK